MKNIHLYLFLLVSLLYNIHMTDKGVMEFADENRYYETVIAVDYLMKGDVHNFSTHINNTQGRPGEAILNIVPVIFQGILYKTKGISPANPDSLKIPVFFNCLYNILVLFFLFKIAYLLFKNRNYALLTVILYKLLINTNIYLRHILPYEKSLICFLLILYLYLKKKESGTFVYVVLGILCGIAFAIYPGYYFIPAFLATLLFINDILAEKKYALFIKRGISVFLGFLSVMMLFELFSRIGSQSYLLSNSTLSKTITQGSFDESLIFPIKYLISIEGVKGVFILISIILVLYLIIHSLLSTKSIQSIIKNPVYVIFIISLIGILFHGILGFVFHKMVFYGRLMHLYFPVLILCLVYVCLLIKNTTVKNGILISMLLIFFISFINFTIKYQNLGYPKSMLYSLKIDNRNMGANRLIYESNPLYKIYSPNPLNEETNAPYTSDSNYLIVNCCIYFFLTDVNDFKKFIPQKNLTRIIEKPHFLTFPAYMMEGNSLEERINITKRKYSIQFYKTK